MLPYLAANIHFADVLNAKSSNWIDCGTAANRNISMCKGKEELSKAVWYGKNTSTITHFWLNFE